MVLTAVPGCSVIQPGPFLSFLLLSFFLLKKDAGITGVSLAPIQFNLYGHRTRALFITRGLQKSNPRLREGRHFLVSLRR